MIASYDNDIIHYKLVSALDITVENSKTCHIVVYLLYKMYIIYYIVNIVYVVRTLHASTRSDGYISDLILLLLLFYYFRLQVYANQQCVAVQLVSVIKNSRAVLYKNGAH